MRLIPEQFPTRHEHRALAAMLLLLHVVIWWDFGGDISRSLMLAHLGLFVLWQPLLRHEQRLNWRGMTGVALLALAIVSALSWILIGFWLLLQLLDTKFKRQLALLCLLTRLTSLEPEDRPASADEILSALVAKGARC